jgi:hypothetical protein
MTEDTPSRLRIVTLTVGYILMCVGVLSILTVPIYVSLIMFAVGIVIGSLSSRAKVPTTRSSWIVSLAGCAVIFVVLACFGQETFRHWRLFPATYIPAWFTCFYGFRHVRHLILSTERDTKVAV